MRRRQSRIFSNVSFLDGWCTFTGVLLEVPWIVESKTLEGVFLANVPATIPADAEYRCGRSLDELVHAFQSRHKACIDYEQRMKAFVII